MKTEKTLKELNHLRNNLTQKHYEDYLNGDLTLKEICKQFNCTQNSLDYFFQEQNWLPRRTYIKLNTRDNYFDKIDTPEKAYIFGFYIADGCIVKNKICFALNEEDLQILIDIKTQLCPAAQINYQKERRNKSGILSHPTYRLAITSDRIVKTLNDYGCGYKKTYLSKSIKNIVPTEYMWDFIRGYFDGDGCISSSIVQKRHITKQGEEKVYQYQNIGFTIISKDKTILDELCSFFSSEGINTHVYPDTKGNFLIGAHSKEEIIKIYKKLYTDCLLFLKRKKEKFDKIMETSR